MVKIMGRVKDSYLSRDEIKSSNLSLKQVEFLGREGYIEGLLVDDGYSFDEDDDMVS